MIRTVIFDMDGVIVNTEMMHLKSVIYGFKKVGIKIKEKEKSLIVGRHPDDYHKDFLKKYDFKYLEFREPQKKKYNSLIKRAPIIKTTLTLIKKLKEEKYSLGLTTTSGEENTKLALKRAKLTNSFKAIVTGKECKEKKPNPKPYLLTAKKLKADPKECLVIEDSPVGITAAKRAGMKCIAIKNKYTKKSDLSKADLIVNSSKEITLDLIKRM